MFQRVMENMEVPHPLLCIKKKFQFLTIMDFLKGPYCTFINIQMDQYFAYKNRLCDLDLDVILEGLSSFPLSLGQYFDKI